MQEKKKLFHNLLSQRASVSIFHNLTTILPQEQAKVKKNMKTIELEGIEYVLYPKDQFDKLQEKITAQRELVISLEKEVRSQ